MRTETKTFKTYPRICREVTILGNDSGTTVVSHPTSKSPGDGDINTGKGGKVYAALSAQYRIEKKKAWIDFRYAVQNGDYGTKEKEDLLTINTSVDFYFPEYDFTSPKYSYVNQKGERVTVQERFTYELYPLDDALYACNYSTDKSRTGWLDVYDDYPQLCKPQDWIPLKGMQFKIDDAGSELYKVGNIGFKVRVRIPMVVTRTVTTSYETLVDENANLVINRDKALVNPTLDQLVNNRPIIPYEDGADEFSSMVVHGEGRAGAWLRGERTPRENIVSYDFPHSTNMARSSEYYLGAILLADSKFRSAQPTKVNFYDYERKPLSVLSTVFRLEQTESFDSVVPTAKAMNDARRGFIQDYRKYVTAETNLESCTTVTFEDFESADGISVGGSIKGVDFGFTAAESKKRVRVFEFKQILYTMSLDDTYKKASDYFTDQLDLEEFRKKMQHYAPVIISTVNFGRVVYLAVSSDDNSAFGINISKNDVFEAKAAFGKSGRNCTFKAITVGGPAGSIDGKLSFDKADDAQSFLDSLCKEMTALTVEAATPIDFEATYLSSPEDKVTTNIRKYFAKYVDKVLIDIWKTNMGSVMTGKLRCLDYADNGKGEMDYVLRSWSEGIGFKKEVSPWACCFELKIDVNSGIKGDNFNVFIPYIPLASIRQNDDGDWVFKVKIGGNTIYSAKNNVEPSVAVPGCYVSKDYSLSIGVPSEAEYVGMDEDSLLTSFFNSCEKMHCFNDSFIRLTSEKTNKTCRGND